MRLWRRSLFVCLMSAFLSLLCSGARGQVTSIGDDTSTPIPGVGHDYIHMLDETVNPANGSVSLRIQVPMPKGRGITIPFAFTYDSNGVNHLVPNSGSGIASWASNTTYLAQGGWSYSVPMFGYSQVMQSSSQGTCYYATNYVFQDPSGSRHSLYLGVGSSNYMAGLLVQCGQNVSVGGDVQYYASTPPGCNNGCGLSTGLVTVSDPNGTVYSGGPGNHTCSTCGLVYSGIVSSIEDRDGNKITVTDQGSGAITMKDTLGRSLTTSGLGAAGTTNSISVSGLANPYQITWETQAANYQVPTLAQNSTQECSINPVNNNAVVAKSITLPNGQQYQFLYYDGTWGLLKQITYPSGAWVQYTWKSSDNYSESIGFPVSSAFYNGPCNFLYAPPVVATRTVSFDGNTPALTQSFVYNTGPWTGGSWGTKTTTVTTTDNILNKTFKTVYEYTPYLVPNQPDNNGVYVASYIPLEHQIQYFDYGGGSTPIRTVTKNWSDPFRLTSQQTILENNMTSQVIYPTYTPGVGPRSAGSQPSEVDEYDFGQSSPTRRTVTNYQTFSGTPGIITDKPCQVIVYTGSTRVAETDYLYDEGASVCGTDGIPSVAAVSNLPTGVHDEVLFGSTSSTERGDVTNITRQCFPNCTNSITTFKYDETGQVVSKIDACGNSSCGDMTGSAHTTMYSYLDSYSWCSGAALHSGNSNAYLTLVTDVLGHTESFCYGYDDGQLRGLQDNNNQITKYQYGTQPSGCAFLDKLGRLSEVDYPTGGGSTTYCYNDNSYNASTPSPSLTVSKSITSSTNLNTLTAFDGLGHPIQTRLTSDPDGITYRQTIYDGSGRAYQQYNPTRCYPPTSNCGEATWGVTTNKYDALNRIDSILEQDGNVVMHSYSGNSTTVTDPAGVSREILTDALGRLTDVFEDPANLKYHTVYGYNGLDDLTSVVQNASNNRNFIYDSLSHLTSATNPESGTATYSYDSNGNLSSRTSPAPNQTGSATVTLTYCYDTLNRVISKAYSSQSCPMSAPIASYLYDQSSYNGLTITNGIGRRTGMTDQAGSEAWAYDSMGRVLYDKRTTNSLSKTIPYTYNLDGSVASVAVPTFPDGSHLITATYTIGGAGRPTTVIDNGVYILENAKYTPAGQLCFGQGAWNQTWTTTSTFNNRLQPATIYAVGIHNGGPAAPPPCAVSAIIPNSGSVANGLNLVYNYIDANGHNNGNVASITNNLNGYFTESFTYDSLNRIATAQTFGTHATAAQYCWAESYQYDPWGNLTTLAVNAQSSYVGCTGELGVATTANTKNQLAFLTYDAAGNVKTNPNVLGGNYAYDAENHLTSYSYGSTVANYTYDGDGKRVMKSTGTIYWYGLNDAPLIETDLSNNHLYAYIFVNGKRTARHFPSNEIDFYIADAIGNTRWLSSLAGWNLSEFYPFGGERVVYSGTPTNYKFTGKERDSESGLDNFGARYNASSMGRFMSPDPFIPFDQKKDKFQAWISNPQHWNKYAYALNNPLFYIDPTGLTETIYYFLNPNLTDEQKKFVQEHKTEILGAISDKLKQAGIQDVVFKDGSTLTNAQVSSMLKSQPPGVAFLNFVNKSYGGVTAGSGLLGGTGDMRSVVFVGNLQQDNPSAGVLAFRLSEVASHELGHGMGFYSRGETMSFIEFWNKDLMNEGQGIPSSPRRFDMSIPQNRKAVDEINKLPEYKPPQ
jgi:RHS repeat-associated protein